MDPNVLSVARRQTVIYQMCQSLATAPLGTTQRLPHLGHPCGPLSEPQWPAFRKSLVLPPMLGGKEGFVYLLGAEEEPCASKFVKVIA